MRLMINFLIFALLSSNVMPAEIVLQNPEVNKQAPAFSGIDSYGNTISLSDFIGQPVILEWTNHECPYVAKHYDQNNMQAVQEQAKKEGFIWLSVISSTPGDQGHVKPSKANELTESRSAYPSHVLLDESGDIGMKYGAKTTPHMYMIDSNGVLRYKGAIDDVGKGMQFFSASLKDAINYVAIQLNDVKDNRRLEISSTVAYGCSVKYNYD